MAAIDELQAVYSDRAAAARTWKAAGGRVVGYFEDNVPEELIIAAGFLPYRLSGDPKVEPTSLSKYLFPMWKKFSLAERQVKLGFINSMLDLLFKGAFDFIDHLVIPYSRKSVLAIWQQLHDAQVRYPELKLPETWILDRAMTPTFASSAFNRERIHDFAQQLEAWSGRPLTEAAIGEAIALMNRQRAAIRRLVSLRAEGRVSGTQALAAIGSGRLMPVDAHVALIERFVTEAADRSPRFGSRLFLAGSPQDNAQLYALVEAEGATIVDENHYWGTRTADHDVRTGLPAIDAVADMYHRKPPSIVYPLQLAIDQCVERAVACRADGVLFSIYAHDNHEIWAVPDQRSALEAAGLPSLNLEQQPYDLGDAQEPRQALRSFLDAIGGSR